MKYRHVMIDLETQATTPDAVILSIGAAAFDPDSHLQGQPPVVTPPWYAVLNREEQHTRRTDPQTMEWWSKQSPEARAVFDQVQMPVAEALLGLNSFFDYHAVGRNTVQVWGNGSDFDNVLLTDLYRWCFGGVGARHGVAGSEKLPWRYHNSRCFRTLKNVMAEEYKEAETKAQRALFHNAADDARYQAEIAARLLRSADSARLLTEEAKKLAFYAPPAPLDLRPLQEAYHGHAAALG